MQISEHADKITLGHKVVGFIYVYVCIHAYIYTHTYIYNTSNKELREYTCGQWLRCCLDRERSPIHWLMLQMANKMGWVKLKPDGRHSIEVSHMAHRRPSTWAIFCCLPRISEGSRTGSRAAVT